MINNYVMFVLLFFCEEVNFEEVYFAEVLLDALEVGTKLIVIGNDEQLVLIDLPFVGVDIGMM